MLIIGILALQPSIESITGCKNIGEDLEDIIVDQISWKQSGSVFEFLGVDGPPIVIIVRVRVIDRIRLIVAVRDIQFDAV